MNDQVTITGDVIGFDQDALDTLLPMNVCFDLDGRIVHAGPTFQKLIDAENPIGMPLAAFVNLRRNGVAPSTQGLLAQAGRRLALILTSMPHLPMRGHCVALPGGAGGMLNMSFGLSFAEVVEARDLTMSDFSPCDHTLDLLYLREANLSVAAESRRITNRLLAAERAAQVDAATDELTGLANRRAFAQAFEEIASQDDGAFAIMQLDLDHFKEINDAHGHHAGDQILCRVADVLKSVVRSRDLAARIGGDEFVLLIRGHDDETLLNGIAGRVIASLNDPMLIDGVEFTLSTSIGTTRSSLYARPEADRMLRDADEALYASKRQGRGRNCFYEPPGMSGRMLL